MCWRKGLALSYAVTQRVTFAFFVDRVSGEHEEIGTRAHGGASPR